MELNLGDEERSVLDALADRQRSGESASLSAAAREAGVNPATARAWRSRHPAFNEAVEVVLARPRPEPVAEPAIDLAREAVRSREQLEAEVKDAKMSLRHETRREGLRLFADVGQARRRLRLAEGRLKAMDLTPWEVPTPHEDAR